ncbi:hypothetical protein ACFPOB_15960 [Bosea eneae]|uniref:Uncharacterized protein n=1 Tax=Bosea eneae TaxID=151454 RepID=A0ABW0IW23_9HYPH
MTSNLISAPRKALLEHLVDAPEAPDHEIPEIAGISPRSVPNFVTALVEEELVTRIPTLRGYVLFITDKGREALANAIVPDATESRKVDDRSAELAKIIANPASVRANVADLHAHLVLDQPPEVAKRNIAHVEQLLALLNGVARKAAA